MKAITLLVSSILLFSITLANAGSFIRVINNSSVNVQAIWQAGFCVGQEVDWAGDSQFTLCKKADIRPGEEERYDFGAMMFDRSVKVLSRKQGQFAYCNSMDYASVTIMDSPDGDGYLTSERHCP